jgi:MoaA/NifB/PqqE/SkfB family radical SAM enzyme
VARRFSTLKFETKDQGRRTKDSAARQRRRDLWLRPVGPRYDTPMANLGYIQVTRECNQRCRFCSNPPSGERLDLDGGKARVDDLVRRGYDGCILTGGEPTLVPFLPDLARYALSRGLYVRMITNGQRIARFDYLKSLVDAGLRHVHVSIHSYRPEVQDFLSATPGSHAAQVQALENVGRLRIQVDVNCVINRHNADHLHLSVRWLCERFPFIRHFVWNNLDPSMNRCAENPDVQHRLQDCEVALHKALAYLDATGRTFRVERMPLCYLQGFEWASTEARKTIKGEERTMHFLDQKGTVHQAEFDHGKAAVCGVCTLREICGGLYAMDVHYQSAELRPVFVDPGPIAARVLGGEARKRRVYSVDSRPMPI